jgi:hypothetical protein
MKFLRNPAKYTPFGPIGSENILKELKNNQF